MFDCHLKLNNYKLNSLFISLNPICPLMVTTSVNVTILCLVTQTPNYRVICLRLGFLEAEPKMEILIQVVHQERAFRKTLVRVWRKEKEVGNVWFQYTLVSVWCLSSGAWRTPEASWPQYQWVTGCKLHPFPDEWAPLTEVSSPEKETVKSH